MFRFLTLTLMSCFAMVSLAHAQDVASNQAYVSQLLKLNRVDPEKNISYSKGLDVLDRRVLDSTHYAIGDVKDVLISQDGKVEKIVADVDSLGFRQEMYFDYDTLNVSVAADSYALMLDRDQLRDNMPAFLEGIEPAAGRDFEPISLKSLMGCDVKAEDGALIGRVSNVQINDKNQEIKALLVNVMTGRKRGKHIAIPFSTDIVNRDHGVAVVEVPAAEAALIRQYLIN